MSSLQEYETQLAEIEEMLSASPDDASLLALKADLLELISATLGTTTQVAATQQQEEDETVSEEETATANESQEQQDKEEEPAALQWSAVEKEEEDKKQQRQPSESSSDFQPAENLADDAAASKPKKKKKKSSSETDVFTIPADLQIRPDADNKFQVQRKKKAIAALRKQHEARTADRTAAAKQQSWQAFAQKKKGKKKNASSMFQTDTTARVGVVGQRRMTKFEGPKKHK